MIMLKIKLQYILISVLSYSVNIAPSLLLLWPGGTGNGDHVPSLDQIGWGPQSIEFSCRTKKWRKKMVYGRHNKLVNYRGYNGL